MKRKELEEELEELVDNRRRSIGKMRYKMLALYLVFIETNG